ncbi:hypothetical protein WR25_03458 [Diploscapter pachys]|uniref:Uncharacterized protein n=1 Tax=Diploscapter pachys TaxID=2018661 RepID=A0A2A2J7Y1_9BILA|nr:hypothetical protein WR25_03458 [Diploscapter pachys]
MLTVSKSSVNPEKSHRRKSRLESSTMQTTTFALISMALFAIAAAEMYGYGYGKRAAGFEEAREKREM